MKLTTQLFASTLLAAFYLTLAPVLALTAEDIARIDASSTPQPGEPSLAEVRKATERFQDVKVALAEGYIADPSGHCEVDASGAAMGIHYFRPDMLGISGPPNPRVDGTGTHASFANPAVLLYEPQKDGSLKLIGVENLVFAKAWAEAGNTKPPMFHGRVFDRMEDDPKTAIDEAHGFTPHFDMHVWLYRENPKGVFAQFNPNTTCQFGHKH